MNRLTTQGNFALLVAAMLVLSAGSGAAQPCPQWDASGQWIITPEGKEKISLDLKQNGAVISGTAIGLEGAKGTVEGKIEADAFSIKITWGDKDGGPKTFIAKVSADGKLDGTTVVLDPLPKALKWTSDRALKCATTR
jgi:hypothetical protein